MGAFLSTKKLLLTLWWSNCLPASRVGAGFTVSGLMSSCIMLQVVPSCLFLAALGLQMGEEGEVNRKKPVEQLAYE